MAGRTQDVSTSSFKPLSLDEIMMVPLAKQQSEDQAQLALDEFSQLEANSLDADKDYVSGQIAAFQKESGLLSDQLMNEGVDRNLINKVRGLRNRKNMELSLEGKTGQASAAYNQFKANEKAIMSRKDLTAAQKEAGLAQAKGRYTGVAEGGQYEDYVGTAHIDLMKRGREIADLMTPEQKAGALGMTVDENGMYRDGTYTYERLTPEQIQRVVFQALKNDGDAMAYAQELQDLGIIENAEAEISNAATSAGNVFQVSKSGEKFSLAPQYLQQAGKTDNTKGMIDTSQPWSKQTLSSGEAAYNKTLNVDSDFGGEVGFSQEVFDTEGNLVSGGELVLEVEDKQAQAEREASYENAKKLASQMNYKDGQAMMIVAEQMYGSTDETEKVKRSINMQDNIDNLRSKNPEAFAGKNDKYVYDSYVQGRKKAAIAYSEVIKPVNPKNTFYAYGEKILGSENVAGDFISTRGIKILGDMGIGSELNAASIAEKLGYTMNEFAQVVGKNGSLLGLSPADPDFPMGPVVQIPSKDGDSFHTLIMSPDRNVAEAYPDPKRMMQNVVDGVQYDVGIGQHLDAQGNVQEYYKHYINRINPNTGEYESKIIRSKKKFTEGELSTIEFGPGKTAVIAGETYNDIDMITYEQVVNQSINGITKMFDEAPTGATSVAQSLKF